MDENCIFCLIMSLFLIISAVACLICIYKLVDYENFYLRLRRKSFLRTLARLGFNSSDSIELYDFFMNNTRLTINHKHLKLILQRIQRENKIYKELSNEKKND